MVISQLGPPLLYIVSSVPVVMQKDIVLFGYQVWGKEGAKELKEEGGGGRTHYLSDG